MCTKFRNFLDLETISAIPRLHCDSPALSGKPKIVSKFILNNIYLKSEYYKTRQVNSKRCRHV